MCGIVCVFPFANCKLFDISFQTCFYCKLKGANIGCCKKSCRKSFHLPCLLENNGLVQFSGKFDAFCHIHHGIERSGIHSNEEICLLCSQSMKEFHPVTSIELDCCGSKWYHRNCFKNLSHERQGNFCCPNCDDSDGFHHSMQKNGIYVYEKWVTFGWHQFIVVLICRLNWFVA